MSAAAPSAKARTPLPGHGGGLRWIKPRGLRGVAPVTCVKNRRAPPLSTSAMPSNPLQISDTQRATLAEFERLHARWRAAVDAAQACCGGVAADEVAAGRLLRQSLEADEAFRLAMQLLRDQPI